MKLTTKQWQGAIDLLTTPPPKQLPRYEAEDEQPPSEHFRDAWRAGEARAALLRSASAGLITAPTWSSPYNW